VGPSQIGEDRRAGLGAEEATGPGARQEARKKGEGEPEKLHAGMGTTMLDEQAGSGEEADGADTENR
jgi:hypothetical protein